MTQVLFSCSLSVSLYTRKSVHVERRERAVSQGLYDNHSVPTLHTLLAKDSFA